MPNEREPDSFGDKLKPTQEHADLLTEMLKLKVPSTEVQHQCHKELDATATLFAMQSCPPAARWMVMRTMLKLAAEQALCIAADFASYERDILRKKAEAQTMSKFEMGMEEGFILPRSMNLMGDAFNGLAQDFMSKEKINGAMALMHESLKNIAESFGVIRKGKPDADA